MLDQYRQIYAEMKQTFLSQPSAQGMQAPLSEGELAEFCPFAGMSEAASAFMSDAVRTQQVDVLRVQASSTVRYYYALMGFAALMSITVSINAVSAARANTSAVGAPTGFGRLSREAIGGRHGCEFRHGILLSASAFPICASCWAWNSVDAMGWRCLRLPHAHSCRRRWARQLGHSENLDPGKTGIATGITCFCALFAGLYGEPSMQLADRVSQSAPWAVLVNPAAQAANAFYDLTYDSLAPFFATLCVLAVMAAVFFVVAALLMRRQNYERL